MKEYQEFLKESNPKVKFELKDGHEFVVELFPEVAPKTVENFLELVNHDFYDGIIFHRVIKGFMAQGGDPTGTGMGGSEDLIPGEFRSNGFKNDLAHTKGVISMARTNDPNSASSQFFIMHASAQHLDGSYAGFGVVTDGLDVIDFICDQKTNYNDKPLEDITIKKVSVL